MQQPDSNKTSSLGVELKEVRVSEGTFSPKSVTEIDLHLKLDLNLKLTNPKGVWTLDLSRNKQAWIEREIILWIIKKRLQL